MVTDCVPAYVPATGEKTGAAAAERLIVYAAVVTGLGDCPGAIAMALTVSVFEMVIGSLHWGDDALGVLPSVVQ